MFAAMFEVHDGWVSCLQCMMVGYYVCSAGLSGIMFAVQDSWVSCLRCRTVGYDHHITACWQETNALCRFNKRKLTNVS